MRLCVWCGAQVCWPLAKMGSRPPGITTKSVIWCVLIRCQGA